MLECGTVISSDIYSKLNKSVSASFADQTKFLSKLVKIDSNNPFSAGTSDKKAPIEEKMAESISKKLTSFGLKPKSMGASKFRQNIVCNVGPRRHRKSLILNGHMDVMPTIGENKSGVLAGSVRGKKLYGPGVLDMKSSLTAYMYAVKAIQDVGFNLDGRVTMAFVVDAQSGSCSEWGTKYLLSKGVRARAAIIGKPFTHTIAIGHRGGYRFNLKVLGEAVHTGLSLWEKKKLGKNAIVDMARAITALEKIEIPFKPARLFAGRKPVFTFPTKIEGGSSVNIVPDEVNAIGDVRLMPGNSDRQIRQAIEEVLSKVPDLAYKIEDLLFVPAVEIDSRDDLVDILKAQVKEVLKETPKVRGVGPWNDAWMYITSDIPTIAGFGPDGGNVHQPDEWVGLDSLKKVTQVYARTIVEYLGERDPNQT